MSINGPYQYSDTQTVLSAKLEELRQHFPEHYSKSIHILPTVHENVQDQFELCLQRESNDHTGERIVLIPCYLGNSHWTGILLEFDVDESINRAEYIDPVNGSDAVPDELQKQFTKVYPRHLLQIRTLQKQNDLIHSATLNIENLLTAANVKFPIAMNCSTEEPSMLPLTTSVPMEGNDYKIRELEYRLTSSLKRYNLTNVDELHKEVQDTNERIQRFQRQGRTENAQEELKFLYKLQELQRVSEEISILTSVAPVDRTNELSTQSLATKAMTLDEQSKKRSYLKDLRSDLTSMPSCAEKTIVEFVIHFEERLLQDFISSQQENSEIATLQKLRDQLKREKLLSENILAILNDLEIYQGKDNYLSVVHCLNKLLNKIRPLNVPEIERLVLKAAETAELIRGQDIILLLGETGTGKSTIIQFLAGCKMIETKVEITPQQFLHHITTDGSVKNPQLKNIISCPLNRSETRYIAPVTVQLKDILGSHENGVITLCDAPGFGDTAGPEVDIANSLGVIEALKQTNSVKLLVLSSYDTLGGRGQGIQKLAHILVNMVLGIEQKFHAMLYAFTKYPQGQNINAVLTDIKTSKVDHDTILQSDSAFVAVLLDMIEKTADMTFKIDPVRDHPRELLKKLKSIKGIQYPMDVFRFSMSNETRASIENHMQRGRIRIDCAMKLKDNKLMSYYLNDLKKLKDLLQQDEIREVYEECKRSISDTLHKYCSEEIKKFNRVMTSQDGLKESDIRDYENAVEYLQEIQIIKEHLGSSLSSPTEFIQNVTLQLQERKCILKEEDLYSPLIGIYLDNFRILKTSFKEIETDYSSSCQEFEKRFEDLVQSVHDLILSNDFKHIAEILVQISKSIHILQNHLGEQVVEKYNNTVKSLLRHLNKFSDGADPVLAKIKLSNDDVKILMNDIEILKSAKENYALREHTSKYVEMLRKKFELSEKHSVDYMSEDYAKDLDEIYDEFIIKIIKCFDEINQRIIILFEKNDDHALEDIEKLVEDMNVIRTIPEIEFKTARIYYNTIEKIRNYMQQLSQDAQQLLYNTDQQSGSIDYRQLVRSLSRLKNTEWINNVSPGTYDTLMSRLQGELVEYAQHLEGRLKKLDLTLNCPDNVCIAQEIIERMEHLCILQNNSSELEKYKKKILQHVSQCVHIVADSIEADFIFSDESVCQKDQTLKQVKESTGVLDSGLINSSAHSYTEEDAWSYVSIKQHPELETIMSNKRELSAQLRRLNSYVKEYEKILYPGASGKITKYLSRAIGRTSQKENLEASNYLKIYGYESIEALNRTIRKFRTELEIIEENKKIFSSSQYCLEPIIEKKESLDETIHERTKLSIKREKNKQSNELNNRSRISAANNALIYVRYCGKISDYHIREIASDINEILRNYLCQYVLTLEQKIKETFNHSIHIEDYCQENPFKYSQDLEINVRELSSLNKFPHVFEYIDGKGKIEHWQEEFLNYHRKLSHKMEEYKISGKSKELQDQLIIAQTLTCLDRFCQIELENNGYGALYRQYQVELIQGCEKAYKIVLDNIEKFDYANVEIHLYDIDEKLLNAIALAHLKHNLQCSLNRLMNDTEYSTNCLDETNEKEENNREQLKRIKDNIETIRLASKKDNILELLDDKTKSRLQNFDNHINNIVSAILLTRLNSIETFLNTDSFIEAEQGMEILTRVQRDLTGYCTSESVVSKSQTLTDRLNNVVTEILNRNNFSDVYSYAIDPPTNILTKLKTIASHCGAKYQQAHTKILALVRQNFISAIENIQTAPLAERMIKIRSLNNALQFLPDELQNPFKLQIDELRKSMIDEEKSYRQTLEACFINLDEDEHVLEKLGILAEQYKKEKLYELLNQLRDQSLRKLHIYRANVRSSLDKQNTQSGIGAIKKILKFKACLSSYIPEIEEICHNVRILTTKAFLNCCETLADIWSIEHTEIVEKAFSDILVYLDFSQTLDPKVEILFSENVFECASEEFRKMCLYLNDNSNKFRAALNEMNIFETHKIMIISKKWNTFLEKINQCRSKHDLIQNLLKVMKSIMLYKDMISELENLVNHINSQLNVELINDDTIKFEIKRDELFTNIVISMRILKTIDSKFKDILPSTVNVDQLEKNLKKKVQRIYAQLLDKACKEELSVKDADDFRMYYNHLVSFEKHVQLSRVHIRQVLETSEEKILDKVISLRKQIIVTSSISVVDVAQILIKMKFLAENLSMFDSKINAEIDEVLKIYKQKQGILGIMQLIVELEKTDIGLRLINEHCCLTGEGWRRRRDKMQKQDDLEYVLRELTGDEISMNILRTRYKTFRKKYDELVSSNLRLIDSNTRKVPDVEVLVTQIKYLVGSVIHTSKSITWNHAFTQEIPQLLAYIFAVWTLNNTEHYNTLRGIEVAQSYLLIPHVGQVIAVFRLLGIGYESHPTIGGCHIPLIRKISDSLVNNLVEVGTGEGKSVVMAITACVFALTGIDVNCSCYSEVLSSRDKNDFLAVFKALGIEERIKYGTFDRLCEQFINEQCDVRDKVRNMIVTNQNDLTVVDITTNVRPKILLIDEVDVFLSEQFYGGTYRPGVILNDPPIKMLLDEIWQNKTSVTSIGVKALPAYKTCATQYSNWIFLFDEAIKDMLAALRSFKSSTYIVRDNKIAYVKGECVVDNLLYGYNTMWAYYHEHEKSNLTEDSLTINVGLIVNCGDFSYAEMPHDFAYIAGVTGTLRTLVQSEKDILKNVYAVHQNTFMPSVFGKSNRNYESVTDVHAVDESEYFMRILGEIDAIRNADRAILVFFESEEKLTTFYNSSELSSIKDKVQIITEKVVVKDRELFIKRAAEVGKVTLLTRIFGRGTDFICDNPQILSNRGIHVLQTFFSQELAEEYQIMGRAARQGDPGSYSMILLDKDLEWVLGSTWKDELSNISDSKLYETINKARVALYESKCGAKNLSIEQCKRVHKISKDFMTAICKGDMRSIKRFLSKENKGESMVKNASRTILLMSATGSMNALLSAVKETICTIFERASTILEEKGLPSDVIQMQFAIYRNYDCRENRILQFSSWHTKPSDLRVFINTVNVDGKWLDEAVEIGLQHAVNESEILDSISQVILVGDAPANTEEKVKHKREHLGEAYWKNTKFDRPTYYVSELKKLKTKNIPVHAFYLNNFAKKSYQEIANMTGGRCKRLSIYSSMGAELLTNVVTEEVLRKAAGVEGDNAVQLYREKYVQQNLAS